MADKVTNDDVKKVLGAEELMTSILAKIYDILTSGDEVAPANLDNFFAWATPGIPVEASDYDFASQGFTGETIDKEELKKRLTERITQEKEALAASGQESSEFDLEAFRKETIDQMQKENIMRLHSHAADFAALVDFIPDVAGVKENATANLQTAYDSGSVSDVYQHALTMSQVMSGNIDKETQEKVDQYRELLGEKMVEQTDILGDKVMVSTKSQLTQAYQNYMAKYEDACIEYNNNRIQGMYGDASARQMWAFNGPTYRKRVKAAMDEWIISGYKTQYEKMAAFIQQVESRDMSILKSNYLDLLDNYKRSNPNGGADYIYTTLSPANFTESGGWTKFSFTHDEVKQYTNSKAHSNSSKLDTSSKSQWHKHKTSNESEKSDYTMDSKLNFSNFKCSFEMCQVRIIRPWFKESFLNSKFWRFDPNTTTGEILSDGQTPPSDKSLMPAYPTSIIFIRNLELSFGEGSGLSTAMDDYKSKKAEYGGSINVGFFNIGAGVDYESASTDKSSSRGYEYDANTQSIRVPGMQIIGYNCHMLPKCPDPSPSITEWEGMSSETPQEDTKENE